MESKRQAIVKVCKDNTNVTLTHGDKRMQAAVRELDCDTKTKVKIEPEVLDIQIGQAGQRRIMVTDCYR